MRKRWLATGMVVALVLAGCGDDDDDTTAATTDTSGGAAATTTTATEADSSTTEAATTATSGAATTAATTSASASATTGASATTAASGGATTPPTAGGSGASGQPACASAVGDLATADTTLDYTLSEFKIEGPDTAPAGAIGLALDNIGDAGHEIVVIRTDDYEALPKNANGTIEDDQLPAGSVIGEVDRFPAKTQCSGVFDLEPGAYQLVCNIEFTNGPQIVSHAGRGMHLALTVT
jgi:hypothetical protein